jgi:prephenate dehydrogenase
MLILGLGYTAGRLAERLRSAGWAVAGTSRDGRGGTIAFDDAKRVLGTLAAATHVLSSVPPDETGDPVLTRYGDALPGRWLGYLSSTGV